MHESPEGHECALTFGRFLQEVWLPAIERTVRASTFYNYCSHVRRHIAPHIGEVDLPDIDGPLLNRLYALLLRNGRTRGRSGPLSTATVTRVHVTIHRALRDAVRWGYLSENAADRCDPPKANADGYNEMRTWDRSGLKEFLAFARDDSLYPLWHLLAMTGMRRGEALGLRWQDVDLVERRLAVRQSVVAVGGRLRVSPPKSARGRRVIALDEKTADVLQRRRDSRADEHLVFPSRSGSFLNPVAVSRRFGRLVRASGLPRIRLHDLRHTHATIALRAGVHPKIVSERLGHSTVSITLDVYSHAVASLQAEAAQLVAKHVLA